jgi:Ca-activated chloride channel family protein
VLILLDVSGSMDGVKIDHARQAVESVWRQLRPGDRLSVVSFATKTTVVIDWSQKGIVSDDMIRNSLNICVADGITLLMEALAEGRRRISGCPSGEPRFIWLITDGQPTNAKGMVMEDLSSYLTAVGELESSGVTLGALGLGDATNYKADFLADLANRGKGSFCYAPQPADLETQLQAQLTDAKAVSCVNGRMLINLQKGYRVLSAARVVPEFCPLDLLPEGDTWSISIGAVSCPETVVMVEVATNAPFGISPGTYPIGNVNVQAKIGGQAISSKAPLELEFAPPGSRKIYERDSTIDNWRVIVEMTQVEEDRGRAKDLGDLSRLTSRLSELAADAGNEDLVNQCKAQLDMIQSQGGLSKDELARSKQNIRTSGRYNVVIGAK